jgi:plastocyanin
MSRGWVATLAALAGLTAAVMPATAADHRITASDFSFDPDDLTIARGDRVIFANDGGTHNFIFSDGPSIPNAPADADDAVWDTPPTREFDTPGIYSYVCGNHSFMSGTINVTAETPTPTPTPIPTPRPGPTPRPTPTPSPAPGPGTRPAAAVQVRALAAAGRSFCSKRRRGCPRPGVRVRIDLSRAAAVTGVLRRRPLRGSARARRFGRVDAGRVAAGLRTLRFSRTAAGRRLSSGRYTLTVRVDGRIAGTLSFKVR